MSYAEYINESLRATFQDLLAKHPEQVKKFEAFCKNSGRLYNTQTGEYSPAEFKMNLSVTKAVPGKGSEYACLFKLTCWDNGDPFISFVYDLYPACCALKQLNFFSSEDDVLEDEFFKEFVEMCIKGCARQISGTARIMINFVEHTRTGYFGTAVTKIPRVNEERITYPIWYRWAKSYPTNETLFVNHNTDRIIHNVVINYQG